MRVLLKIIITIVVGFLGFIMIPAILMEASGRHNVFINLIIWVITGAFLAGVWRYGNKGNPQSDNHRLKKD